MCKTKPRYSKKEVAMGRKKKEQTELEKSLKAVANYYLERMQKGEKINILTILEELLNAFMVAERDLYLTLSPEN